MNEIPKFKPKQNGFAAELPCWEIHPPSDKVTIHCVEGHATSLTYHKIADDGTVSMMVQCHRCNWHEHIKLAGWEPPKQEPPLKSPAKPK